MHLEIANNNLVTIRSDLIEEPKSCDAADLLKKIQDGVALPMEMGLLPPAVRWVSKTGRTLMLERPPFMTSLTYHGNKAGENYSGNTRTYDLPIPWSVMTVFFRIGHQGITNTPPPEVYLYARNGPLTGVDDVLYHLPLPNTEANGRCCVGSDFSNAWHDWLKSDPNPTVAKALNIINLYLWSGVANQDLSHWWEGHRIPNNFPPGLQDGHPGDDDEDIARWAKKILREWAKYTLADVLSWSLRPMTRWLPGSEYTGEPPIITFQREADHCTRYEKLTNHSTNIGGGFNQFLSAYNSLASS